jgi:hypothetical protein
VRQAYLQHLHEVGLGDVADAREGRAQAVEAQLDVLGGLLGQQSRVKGRVLVAEREKVLEVVFGEYGGALTLYQLEEQR